MNPVTFTFLFAGALLLSVMLKLWLASRQMRYVARHQQAVPAAFAEKISLEAHQKAARYTLAKGKFGVISLAFGSLILVGWTLVGGLDVLNTWVLQTVPPQWGSMAYPLGLISAFMFVGGLLDLPLDLYSTFRLEQRFGFNRITPQLYALDMVKSVVLGLLIGLPIAALILWIMTSTGALWWLWAWGAWVAINLSAMVIYPLFISPLFNKFEPLKDESVKQGVESLMQRCGFTAKGFFVMDGSKRSGHSNAYFTGLGKAKRVVFFDTLLASLSPPELEAVLAHELGHFKHKHVLKRMLMMFAMSLGGFALLGWLMNQPWFFMGLGVQPNLTEPNQALGLLLFLLVMPVFGFFMSPIMAQFSRKDEFEADAYARSQTNGQDLAHALLKLYEDNANTLTPDPVYARFYFSHPPASERIRALTS
jgi:STE24 endopeptidase